MSVFLEYAKILKEEEREEREMGFFHVDESEDEDALSSIESDEEFTSQYQDTTGISRAQEYSSIFGVVSRFGASLRNVLGEVFSEVSKTSNPEKEIPSPQEALEPMKVVNRDPKLVAAHRHMLENASLKRLNLHAKREELRKIGNIDQKQQGDKICDVPRKMRGKKSRKVLSYNPEEVKMTPTGERDQEKERILHEAINETLQQRPDLILTSSERFLIAKHTRMPFGKKGATSALHSKPNKGQRNRMRIHTPRPCIQSS